MNYRKSFLTTLSFAFIVISLMACNRLQTEPIAIATSDVATRPVPKSVTQAPTPTPTLELASSARVVTAPSATDSEETVEAAATETETVNAAGEQATAEMTPAQPTSLPPVAASEGLQVLVATQDDSLALWQDGTLNKLANTADVFAAVFVGDSGNIAYVRKHEVWCMDTLTRVTQQVPLPLELVSTIPYEYEAPDNIFWLTSLGNSGQVVAAVFHGTGAYGTILVDCGTDTSQLIESTNPGYPVVAPDGSKIAIAGATAITVYDLASGVSKVLLMFEPIGTYTSASFFPIVSWSSDSTQIVTVINPQDWWDEDAEEPSIVYRLAIESGEVEVVAQINRMFVREPYTAVAYDIEKLAYSVPADPLATPSFAYTPTKQMILDLNNGAETLLFEGNSGFMGWNPFFEANTRFTGLNPWNPSGDRVSFWEGSDPFNQKIGVYDLNTGRQLEQRLPGTFAGWVDDTSFLYSADGTLYRATIVGTDIVSSELAANIDRVHQARVLK